MRLCFAKPLNEKQSNTPNIQNQNLKIRFLFEDWEKWIFVI